MAVKDKLISNECLKAVNDSMQGQVSDLKSAIEQSHLVTETALQFTWERGNINSSGNNANSSRYVRSANYVTVTHSPVKFTFDGSYSAYSYYTIYLYSADGTFVSLTSKTADYEFTCTPGQKIRVLIAVGSQDTETTVDVSAGDTIIQTAFEAIANISTDKTLTIHDRPADAKATGDAINAPYTKSLTMEWERGKISSSGSNSSSSSTVYIRTGYRYAVKAGTVHIAVPSGVTAEIRAYESVSGDDYIGLVGTYTADADVAFANDTYIRLVAYYTNLSDTPLSVGNSVIISQKVTTQGLYEKITNDELNDYSCLSMFKTVGVIGDSWASGSIHVPVSGYIDTYYDMSWVQMLARKMGFTATNYSKGGLSSKTWLSDTSYGLTKLLADDPLNLYIIALGINDNTQIGDGTLTLGSIDDVDTSDYTQNPDTFFGDYGRIIGNIKEHAPKAVIVCLSVARPNERNMDAYIKAIADKYEIPFIQLTDDDYFISGYFYRSIYDGHMSAFGYSGMANAIQRLIQNNIVKNPLLYAYYDGATS